MAASPRVILGRDTRESSPWIAATLAAGICARRELRVESAGVVPTPAVAFLARTHGFQAGVVISASHNPWQDNGIKLFGSDGFKLADAVELAMEDEILHHAAQIAAPDPATLPAGRGQRRVPGRLHPVSHRLRAGPLAGRAAHCGRLRQRSGGGGCAGALSAAGRRGRRCSTSRPTAATSTRTAARCIPPMWPPK